jgi:hypothetical protein
VTISYDEKPGIQELATRSADLSPKPNRFRSHLRDYEYRRLGTVSLLAGLDLHTARVTEIVRAAPARTSLHFEQTARGVSAADPDSPAARQPFGAHVQGNPRVTEPSPPTIRVCLHAKTRFMAEHREYYVQQNGAQHTARNPRRQQAGTDRSHPSLLPTDQCGPGDLPLEVQNGFYSGGEGEIRNLYISITCVSYRFRVADNAKNTVDPVDHCTLLHAGFEFPSSPVLPVCLLIRPFHRVFQTHTIDGPDLQHGIEADARRSGSRRRRSAV